INYETIIHPLWKLPRLAADGVTNVTCTNCHAPTNAAAPAAQLDLSDGPSTDEPTQFKAYRELLFVTTHSPPASPNDAAASIRLFAPFAPGGSHAGWLTPVELKLVSEWLDIGAQYFNDPFAVPQA